MKIIDNFEFPENSDEANKWLPYIRVYALASKVLVVAKTRIEGKWSAYCDAVPGINHDQEYEEVLKYGDKLPESVARAIFPQLKNVPYSH